MLVGGLPEWMPISKTNTPHPPSQHGLFMQCNRQARPSMLVLSAPRICTESET